MNTNRPLVNNIAIMPPGTPLIAGKKKAAEIFDTSERKIDYLRKKYKDFPCFKFGGSIMFDIPRCYDWFSDFLGGKLDMDLDDE